MGRWRKPFPGPGRGELRAPPSRAVPTLRQWPGGACPGLQLPPRPQRGANGSGAACTGERPSQPPQACSGPGQILGTVSPGPGRQPGGDLLPNLAVPMATLFYSILLPKLLVGFPTVTQAGPRPPLPSAYQKLIFATPVCIRSSSSHRSSAACRTCWSFAARVFAFDRSCFVASSCTCQKHKVCKRSVVPSSCGA
jgi:hypothetical protein